jgi:cytochrome c oxidase subunit 2
MGGKRDVMPGTIRAPNHIWYTPNADLESMVWNGFCTEYCGSSHANMRIRAYTVTPAEFESWAAGQRLPAALAATDAAAPAAAAPAGKAPAGKAPGKAPAKSGGGATASAAPGTMVAAVGGDIVTQTGPAYMFPTDKLPDYAIPKTPYPAGLDFDDALLAKGDAARGRELFTAAPTMIAACKTCHALNGIPGAVMPLAPNLTHIASRHTIAAGLYPNDAPHLARWIKDAPMMKPGAKMNTWGTGRFDPMTGKMMGSKGSFGALTDQQIADLVAFLLTLK